MAKIYFINRVEPLIVNHTAQEVMDALAKIKTGDKTYVYGLRTTTGPTMFVMEQVQYVAP